MNTWPYTGMNTRGAAQVWIEQSTQVAWHRYKMNTQHMWHCTGTKWSVNTPGPAQVWTHVVLHRYELNSQHTWHCTGMNWIINTGSPAQVQNEQSIHMALHEYEMISQHTWSCTGKKWIGILQTNKTIIMWNLKSASRWETQSTVDRDTL